MFANRALRSGGTYGDDWDLSEPNQLLRTSKVSKYCFLGYYFVNTYVYPSLKLRFSEKASKIWRNHPPFLTLGTVHLRRRQIFTIFYPYPPPVGRFFYYVLTIRRQIWPIFDPSPPKNADVLNGWSLCSKYHGKRQWISSYFWSGTLLSYIYAVYTLLHIAYIFRYRLCTCRYIIYILYIRGFQIDNYGHNVFQIDINLQNLTWQLSSTNKS